MQRRSCAIVLIGQSSLLREGLRHILGASGSSFQIAASAATVDDLAWAPTDQNQPLLLIIDAGGEPRALARQIATFKTRQPSGRVVVLADQDVAASVLAAFHAGANAYYHKAVESEAFVKALELVALGETILAAGTAFAYSQRQLRDRTRPRRPRLEADAQKLPLDFDPKLSSREEYILKFIGEGYPNKIIARKMGIAEGTVKVHVKAILRKRIRVGNRTQRAVWLKDNPMSAPARGLAHSVRDRRPAPPTGRPRTARRSCTHPRSDAQPDQFLAAPIDFSKFQKAVFPCQRQSLQSWARVLAGCPWRPICAPRRACTSGAAIVGAGASDR